MWKELKNAITASSNSSNTRVDKSGLAIGSSGWLVLIDNYTHQASFQKRMVVKKQTFAIIGPGSHKNVCSLWDNTVCTMFGTMGYIMCGTMICGTIICGTKQRMQLVFRNTRLPLGARPIIFL